MTGIGIDFGTSNSAAACFDGTRVHFINVEEQSAFFPTAIHFDRNLQTLTGSEAIKQYVEENRARRVEITAKAIGEAAYDVREVISADPQEEPGGDKQKVYGVSEDHGLPGRLFLGLKRLLGQEGLKRISIFEQPFRLVALITPILIFLQRALHKRVGDRLQSLHMGRPIFFEGRNSNANETAIGRLREASAYAGFDSVHFYPEPVAACLSFMHQANISEESVILTIDFGGGTLDLSLVRFSDEQFEVLDTAGAAIGGDHIDQKIYSALVFPELGKGIHWTRPVEGKLVTGPFPFHLYERALLNWTITHTLNQNEYLTRLGEYIDYGGPELEKIKRLRDVIQHNYSYNVIEAIRTAKAELSESESTVLDIPELDLSLTFTRPELNALLDDVLDTLRERIESLLARNGMVTADVSYLVRTGGSSQIVAVVELLEQLFPGKVVAHDPFTSVASGLAIANYHGYQWTQEDS